MQVTLNITEIVTTPDQDQAYQNIKDQFEPALLHELLAFTDNNKTQSARIAGLHVSTLERKLKQHGMTVQKQVSSRGGEV